MPWGIFIFVSVIVGIALLCFTAIAIVSLIVGKGKKNRGGDAEDARLMQEIHQGMIRMEKRIEALETIVIKNEKPHNGPS